MRLLEPGDGTLPLSFSSGRSGGVADACSKGVSGPFLPPSIELKKT